MQSISADACARNAGRSIRSVLQFRSGTPRFFGIGNGSLLNDQTNYTNQQELIQVQVGLNLTHAWQLLYTTHFQDVDVLPGTLSNIASIQTRFNDVSWD